MPKRKVGKPLCPRCGRPVDWVERVRIGGRVYLYAVHYGGYEKLENGKARKKVEKCYLGPEDAYIYATTTHENLGLVLKGTHDSGRVLDYLDALVRYLERPGLELRSERLRQIAAKLRELADSLDDIADAEELGEA